MGIMMPETCWVNLTLRSARVPAPHNRSQHIQANTTRGFIQYVLLTMGIMMSETCWVDLLWINIYTCVICWFFVLLRLKMPYLLDKLRPNYPVLPTVTTTFLFVILASETFYYPSLQRSALSIFSKWLARYFPYLNVVCIHLIYREMRCW